MATDVRKSRAWKKLRDQVLAEEPLCQLRYNGCTGTSTEADHIKTVKARPDLALERTNVRGVCEHCHDLRSAGGDSETRRAPALDWFD